MSATLTPPDQSRARSECPCCYEEPVDCSELGEDNATHLKTYTAKEAHDLAMKTLKVEMGTNLHRFTMIGWKNKSGEATGPFLVTDIGGQIIEVTRTGTFFDTYSGDADGYFPWITV